MEFLLDLIVEIGFGIANEASTDKRVSKWIRYPLITMILLFAIGFSLALTIFGIHLVKLNKISESILIFALAIMFIVLLCQYIKRLLRQ